MANVLFNIPLTNVARKFKARRLLRPRSLFQITIILILVYLCYILGLFTHLLEKDLKEFRYPLKIDVRVALQTLYKDKNSAKYLEVNTFNYTYLHKSDTICEPFEISNDNDNHIKSNPYLVILVKSKLTHFTNRDAIRKTWGQFDQFKLIRTVFLIGIPSPTESINSPIESSKEVVKLSSSEQDLIEEQNKKLNQRLEEENRVYNDIVQQNFYDTYYNNTIKTFMGIKWINEYCTNAQFYLFIDDDFYLNPSLLMKYLANNVTEAQLSTFYGGFVFANSSPMRHLLSKWYISLKEYPYHKFPPYVAAGCYILSRQSAHLFLMASKLIQVFRFDDIYMGILAHKLDIKPLHIEEVKFYAPPYLPSVYSTSIIAAHGFTPDELNTIWIQLENFIKFKSSKEYIL